MAPADTALMTPLEAVAAWPAFCVPVPEMSENAAPEKKAPTMLAARCDEEVDVIV